ncbi:MAG: hypothetical protein WCF03_20380 [Nitrososphaeraceae archaeon]
MKLWAGATTGAKATRTMYNIPGGQQGYDLELRKAEFQKADQLANMDEILRAGVQVAPIVELIVRNHNVISLKGSAPSSPIRTYIMKSASLTYVTSNDLLI